MKKARLFRGLAGIFLAIAVAFSVVTSVATAWAGKVDELGLTTVLTIEGDNHRIAQTIVENLLLANAEEGSITAIWAAWDEPAIGAAQALKEAGRDEVIVTGVDGNQQAVSLVAEDGCLKATVAQNFEGMAAIVVEEMEKLFDGQEIEFGEKYAPATLITLENIEDFLE